MPNYDFRSLSPRDFELLARDLVQAHVRLYFESFTTGPDQGIDFRASQMSPQDAILQVKHYADSGADALVDRLKRHEVPKVRALAPSRYFLATSVGLSPRRKSQIVSVFQPYCISPEDIFSKDDLNNLLGLYPDIERKHYKLWLTSTEVLERLLHAGVFEESNRTIERLRRFTSRYVPNESYERASQILEDSHYCIIAGIPGIGKTTLAELLLVHYIDHLQYQPIRISQSLLEIRGLRRRGIKQIYYFDDFLGRTGLANLARNEDRELLEFAEEVSHQDNWRFILTTREYVLRAAERESELLAQSRLDLRTCTVVLNDYTRPIRAQILYNHIYFSDLTSTHKRALLEKGAYRRILGHRNYSPRVIERMTNRDFVAHLAPDRYLATFLLNLENPQLIWRHAFEQQISEPARHLVLLLGSFPGPTRLGDFEIAFQAFYNLRRKEYGFSVRTTDFMSGLKEIEGTFVTITASGGETVVGIRDPSVQDFLEHYLSEADHDVLDLLNAGQFFEQLRGLWRGRQGSPYRALTRHPEKAAAAMSRILDLPSSEMSGYTMANKQYYRRSPALLESRVEFSLDVAERLRTALATETAKRALGELKEQLERGDVSRSAVIGLVQRIRAGRIPGEGLDGELYSAARDLVLAEPDNLPEYEQLCRVIRDTPDILDESQRARLQDGFARFYEEEVRQILRTESDADVLESQADDLEFVGRILGIPVPKADKLRDRVAEMRDEEENEEGSLNDSVADAASGEVDEIDAMFAELLIQLNSARQPG